MILRGIHIENWSCIGRAALADLPLGVIVLHGPNQTGKSSLVRAIRSCLFDHDHDTTKEEVRGAVPWNTDHSPKVAIEFETAGQMYRLTKQFSKRKDGLARLERREGTQWIMEVADPKEASRRARELLGCENSGAGLNQLLWLHQGEISLPRDKNLDPSLVKQLRDVLGTLLTSRDDDIKHAIDERCERWWTASGGPKGGKKPSPVVQLELALEELSKALTEEEKNFRSLEQVIADIERCEDGLPGLEQAVTTAKQELDAVAAEREATRTRRQQFNDANRAVQDAQKERGRIEKRLQEFEAAKKRWNDSEEPVSRGQAAVSVAQEQRDVLARQLEQATQHLGDARQAEEEHRKGRQEVDDKKEWLTLGQRHALLTESLRQADTLASAIEELEQAIKGIAAPDSKVLEELRKNRQEAMTLRAQLQAEELTLAIRAEHPATVTLAIDGQASAATPLPQAENRSWPFRQRAGVDIPGWGKIEVARGQADQDLVRATARLGSLDENFGRVVRAFGENPDDAACVDRLLERRLQLDTKTGVLAAKRDELRLKLPRGRAALEAELGSLDRQRGILRDRCPALAQWQGDAAEAQRLESAFAATTTALEKTRKSKEKTETDAREALGAADKKLGELKEAAAGARATAKSLKEELERHGDQGRLREDLTKAEGQVAEAEKRLAAAALTEAEQTVDQRHTDADTALRQRQQRCQEAKDHLNRLRGIMEANQGLHARRADAAAAVFETEQRLNRQRLEADACLRLRTLFDECKKDQVELVLGPIGGRVLEWAKSIGLDDYREVRFGDRFLPEGVTHARTGSETIHALGGDSYGTEEQLSILVRLALGGVLARGEPAVCILDDPLAHADPGKHRRMLDILRLAAAGNDSLAPPAGQLQILILTCHPDRFDYLRDARHFDLARLIERVP